MSGTVSMERDGVVRALHATTSSTNQKEATVYLDHVNFSHIFFAKIFHQAHCGGFMSVRLYAYDCCMSVVFNDDKL